ncbi:hypothetical protein RCH06_001891 [Polaromonas sp. CG_9.5]|uniref:hypothetical protein n=1 Tax=Polaromonas sp. CG_9.5 TaxID=3071705 RepID=UPI002DFE2DE2|nr:hypothetical protein [Polaromonas sp. CG_9.5]
MLMITIDNPTEAAAKQMAASRKFIVFINKMGQVAGDDLPALSMIPQCGEPLIYRGRSAMLYANQGKAVA